MESMLDFVKLTAKMNKTGNVEVSPSFKVIRSKDLMIRGNSFYSIWDENLQKWSTDEFDAINIIDQMTIKYAKEKYGDDAIPQLLINADNCLIDKWKKYCQKQAINNYKALDETLIFSNMEKKRENYIAPIARTIEIVTEQAVLSASTETEVPDFDYGGDLSN